MKNNNVLRVILTCFAVIIFACMAMGSNFSEKNKKWDNELKNNEKFKEYCVYINSSVEACTGTCLTREEMAQLVYNFEKIQKRHNGEELVDRKDHSGFVLVLVLETPGEHEHDENTRYSITTLEKDTHDFYKGLKVSVMEDASLCNIEDNTQVQPPVEDNTGSITEQTEPVETDNTQNDEQKARCWKLNKKRTYIKEGDPTSYTEWKYGYDASELYHMYAAYLPPNHDREASDTAFTATCTAPPEIINPGDKVSFTLDLDMRHTGGMLVTATSCMLYGTPDDDGKGIKYNGTKFRAEIENQPDTCSLDTMYNSNIRHVVVQHTFDNEGTSGSELAIAFFGCDSMTLWIYEWIE